MSAFFIRYFAFIFFLSVVMVNPVVAQTDSTDQYVQDKNSDQAKKSASKQKNKESFADKLRYGGSFGAFFGQQTYIELSPKVGYKVNERLIAGAGLNYIYFSMRDYGQRFVTHIYGPTAFAQFALYSGIFAYGEFNAFNVATYNPLPPYTPERVWIGSAPIGIGYYNGGQIGGVYLSLLYDLINDPLSPYYNGGVPVLLRVGFLF
jgi:hypothetical protein